MSKVSRRIMIVLALCLVFVMVFAGCAKEEFKQAKVPGGNAKADVTNNGGLAVMQGEYLYYINSITSLSDIKKEEDNAFGKPIKGAIMRCKIDANGNAVEKKTLVPLVVLSGTKDGGITVYGNWVYYTTPSTEKNKQGALMTSHMIFMRTSIDGTTTQVIDEVSTNTVKYMYTPSALIYQDGTKLMRVSYDNSKVYNEDKDIETIASGVQSVLFPVYESYSPATGIKNNTIFYTKAAKDSKATYNVTYAVDVKKGSKPHAIIDGDSYIKEADKDATESEKKKSQYTITLQNYNIVADGIEVYYEKANANNPENKAGLFGAMYKDGKLDVANEVRLTDKTYGVAFPKNLNDGIYVFENNKLILMKEKVENGLSIFDKSKAFEFSPSATIVDFMDYTFGDKTVESVIYTVNGELYVRALDDTIPAPAKKISDEKYSLDVSWLQPEIIGNRLFFFNTNFYGYIDSIDLVTGKMLSKDTDKLDSNFAKLTAKDKKANEDRIKAEKEEAEKNENK